MRLYLVENGESRPAEVDPLRRLTTKGLANAVKLADFLYPMKLTVRAVWHSGATRLTETAELLAEAVSAKLVVQTGLGANDPVWPARRLIEQAGGDLIVVGQQPFLGKLAALLLNQEMANDGGGFWFGGMLCLDRSAYGNWRVARMVVPHLISPAHGYAIAP